MMALQLNQPTQKKLLVRTRATGCHTSSCDNSWSAKARGVSFTAATTLTAGRGVEIRRRSYSKTSEPQHQLLRTIRYYQKFLGTCFAVGHTSNTIN